MESGNFVFRTDVMLEELARFEPDIANAAAAAVAGATKDLGFVVLTMRLRQSAQDLNRLRGHGANRQGRGLDGRRRLVGHRRVVGGLAAKSARRHGNSFRGRAVAINSANVLVRSEEQLTAVVGLRDVIVVTTRDAVLVADRSQSEKVKALVERLKAEGQPEATQHVRIYRPWGYYQSIDQGSRYQVSKSSCAREGAYPCKSTITGRSIGWCSWPAEVTLNGKVEHAHENEWIYLPIGSTHRLANPGKIDLELIEVQTGSYFGEDDIVRIEDDYSRK